MTNEVLFFEIPAEDPKKLISFYKNLFNWDIDQTRNDYWVIGGGGVRGGLMKKLSPIQVPINYIRVTSIDEHSKKVEARGGRVIQPFQAVPGLGWYAIVADPEGNAFGLWQDDPSAA